MTERCALRWCVTVAVGMARDGAASWRFGVLMLALVLALEVARTLWKRYGHRRAEGLAERVVDLFDRPVTPEEYTRPREERD